MAGAFKNKKGESYLPGELVEWDGVSYSLGGGKTRDKPVAPDFLESLMAAARATDPSLEVRIVSGGQIRDRDPALKDKPGGWTGSTRHDIDPDGWSRTADVVLVRNGKNVTPSQDKGLYLKFMQNAAQAGFPGLGHYSWGVHVGGGSQAAWGPDRTSKTLDADFSKAISAGRKSYASGQRLPYADIPGPSAPRPATMPQMLRTPNSADEVVRDFEGFKAEPYKDNGSWRIGFGSDTITRPDGTFERVKPGMTVTREDAQRDLERRLPEFEQQIIKQVGTEAWNKLPRESQSAVKSMAYNYGSLGGLPSLVRAIKSGDPGKVADEIEARAGDNGGINEKRRLAEAALVRKGIAPTPAQMSAGLRGAPGANPPAVPRPMVDKAVASFAAPPTAANRPFPLTRGGALNAPGLVAPEPAGGVPSRSVPTTRVAGNSFDGMRMDYWPGRGEAQAERDMVPPSPGRPRVEPGSSPKPTQSQMMAMRLLPTSGDVDAAMASNGTTGRQGNAPPFRPFESGEFVQNSDGTQSTERTITWQTPEGKWVNTPTLFQTPNGVLDLSDPSQEPQARQAATALMRSGVQFPSFANQGEAVAAARARSAGGGAFQGARGVPGSSPRPTQAQMQAMRAVPMASAASGNLATSLLRGGNIRTSGGIAGTVQMPRNERPSIASSGFMQPRVPAFNSRSRDSVAQRQLGQGATSFVPASAVPHGATAGPHNSGSRDTVAQRLAASLPAFAASRPPVTPNNIGSASNPAKRATAAASAAALAAANRPTPPLPMEHTLPLGMVRNTGSAAKVPVRPPALPAAPPPLPASFAQSQAARSRGLPQQLPTVRGPLAPASIPLAAVADLGPIGFEHSQIGYALGNWWDQTPIGRVGNFVTGRPQAPLFGGLFDGLFGQRPQQQQQSGGGGLLGGGLLFGGQAARDSAGRPIAVGGTKRNGATYSSSGGDYGSDPGQKTGGLKPGERKYDADTNSWGLK